MSQQHANIEREAHRSRLQSLGLFAHSAHAEHEWCHSDSLVIGLVDWIGYWTVRLSAPTNYPITKLSNYPIPWPLESEVKQDCERQRHRGGGKQQPSQGAKRIRPVGRCKKDEA